jgi:TolA-binding protein
MLKPYRRITKKELKQDKFLTYTIKSKEFIEKNSRTLMYGGVAILVVILLTSFYMNSKRQANFEAVELLGKAQFTIMKGDLTNGEAELKTLVENYDGVTAAGQGCFLLAKFYWRQDDLANAKIYFKKYIDNYSDDDLLTSAAYAGYADCLVSENNLAEAAKNYEKAARVDKDLPQAPDFLYSAAKVYVDINDLEKGKELATDIVENYPTSEFKQKAEILLGIIKLKV